MSAIGRVSDLHLNNMNLSALPLLLVLLAVRQLLCVANSAVVPLHRQAEALLQWKTNLEDYSDCLDTWSNRTSACN